MGLEIITDELIEHLLRTRKTVHNPKARKKRDSGSERVKYAVSDVENNQFSLYVRQNYKAGMADDFSCGLSYLLANGELFTLVRYNGSSHIHTNKLDGTKIEYACHIHRATRLYLDETGNSGGYAEKTNRYRTLAGALYCLLKDCNIEGLPADPDQPELFETIE